MGVMTDFPERMQPDTTIYIGDKYEAHTIINQRQHASGLLVLFREYQNREDVGKLRNKYVYVRADDRPPLGEGEYYHHELIGLQVLTDDEKAVGILSEILETGANDVYVVRSDKGKEVLLPAIEEVVLEIDLEAGEIQVHLLEGLGE